MMLSSIADMMIPLTVFVLAISAVAVEGSCPSGFIRESDSCYWFSLSTASNFEASRLCHHLGSHLAIITSRHEDNFIRNFLQRYGKAFAYWVGASDLRIENTWTWDETVPIQKLTYTNWSPGQPDNYNGREHCMELKRPYSGYQWNDANCNNHINYICETSAGNITCA